MQHRASLAGPSHISDVLTTLHFVPFPHMQLFIVSVGAQNPAVVLHYHQLPVSDESAARVDHSTWRRRLR